MTHFYQTVKRLEAIEGFLWGMLAIVAVLVWLERVCRDSLTYCTGMEAGDGEDTSPLRGAIL